MLHYETFSVQSLLALNQMHTSAARLPGELARRALRPTNQHEQAQRVGAYILLERIVRRSIDRFRKGVQSLVKPEFNSFFDAHSPLADLHYDSVGKPYFAGHENVTVSIAHDGYLVAAALVLTEEGCTAAPVGIDVQHVDYDLDRAERIAERYYSDGEKLLLAPFAGQKEAYCRAFTRIWVRKEALLKYMGTGLAAIMQADTTHLPANCAFEDREERLSYAARNGKKQEELYYISVCTSPNEFVGNGEAAQTDAAVADTAPADGPMAGEIANQKSEACATGAEPGEMAAQSTEMANLLSETVHEGTV